MQKNRSLLGWLITLTALGVVAQIAFVLAHYLGLGGFAQKNLTEIPHWTQLIFSSFFKDIVWFIIAHLLLSLAFVGLIWSVAQGLGGLFRYSEQKIFILGIFIWFFAVCLVLLANLAFFPASLFATPFGNAIYHTSFQHRIALYGVWFLLIPFAAMVLLASLYWFTRLLWSYTAKIIVLIPLALFTTYFGFQHLGENSPEQIATTEQRPNLFIISFDGLRPDFLGFYGKQTSSNTPNINAFLRSANTFDNAITPLARSYPSWVSLLTGLYPRNSGARFNLTNPERLTITDTLAKGLKRRGYETLFSADGSQFLVITKELGFDKIISPKAGINNFVFTLINDFPLSNLIMNTSLGRFLFPFNYANSDSAVNYDFASFQHLLKNNIEHHNKMQPLFLAVHLGRAHYPLTWAGVNYPDTVSLATKYKNAIQQLDQQFADIMTLLQTNHLLQHAIVIIVSDHGSALGLKADRLISESTYQSDKSAIKSLALSYFRYSYPDNKALALDTSYGHGTDVLSPSQQNVLLAFKTFGAQEFKPKQIKDRVSLMDITPTIFDLFKIQSQQSMDGISLAPYLRGETSAAISTRNFYLEDGYRIPAIEQENIDKFAAAKQGLYTYKFDLSSGKVYMRDDAMRQGVTGKQFAIIHDDWLVASYPALKPTPESLELWSFLTKNNKGLAIEKPQEKSPTWVLLNLKSGEWTTDFTSAFAVNAHADELKTKLLLFNAQDIKNR